MAEDDIGIRPQLIEGERDHNLMMEDPAVEKRGAYREPVADRYRLKAPTFAGNEDEEQFIMDTVTAEDAVDGQGQALWAET